MSCQPTKTEDLTFELSKLTYVGKPKLQAGPKALVIVEQHLACKCDCKVKENDCIPSRQEYDPSKCSCVCKNTDEQEKCHEVSFFFALRFRSFYSFSISFLKSLELVLLFSLVFLSLSLGHNIKDLGSKFVLM